MKRDEEQPVWVRDVQEEWIVVRLAIVLAVAVVAAAVGFAVWWFR
jgi:nitrate reductase NapE component